MARVCDFCTKHPTTGNKISHSNIKTRTRWLPNLKKVRNFKDGATSTVYVCTRCIKSGKITKPPVRRFKATAETTAHAK